MDIIDVKEHTIGHDCQYRRDHGNGNNTKVFQVRAPLRPRLLLTCLSPHQEMSIFPR